MHPPFARLFIGASVALSDMRWWAARLPSVIASALAVAFVYLLGCSQGLGSFWALFAALFFLFDGTRYVHSRMAALDAILVGTVVVGAYLAGRAWAATGKTYWANLIGFALVAGAAVGTKWTGLAVFGVGAVALIGRSIIRPTTRSRETRSITRTILTALTLLLVPAAIYVGLYYPLVRGAGGLKKIVGVVRSMYDEQVGYDRVDHPDVMAWWLWPFFPRMIELARSPGGESIQFLPNPLIWALTVPAALTVLVRWAIKRRDGPGVPAAVGVLAHWLPWALVSRPQFSWWYLPAIPFGCLSTAHALRDLAGRWFKAIGVGCLVAALLVFALYWPNFLGRGKARAWLWPHKSNPTAFAARAPQSRIPLRHCGSAPR